MNITQKITTSATLLALVTSLLTPLAAAEMPGREPGSANPILPGYYADPSVAQDGGKIFLYATLDPWGGDTLGCWESTDFKQWSYRVLNWPTKAACTSPQSALESKVWAPSVVLGPDKKFHMFVSVGSEVWVGVADQPLGPWRDSNGGKPVIPRNYRPGYHMIDAEAFVDTDGTPWLYWGSGNGWVNGKCWAVKLNREMNAFAGEVHDVTPTNYFEGPIMVKRHGLYFLMYSQGITIKDTYQVHYAVGDNPLGPFKEGPNSPVLVTDKEKNVISPGHHTIFHAGGKDYILYHRHSIPFNEGLICRQACVDEIKFLPNGSIAKVTPTHVGPALVLGRDRNRLPATASASSEAGPLFAAGCATDGNYATHWQPADPKQESWLQLDLGKSLPVSRQEIRFEYAWKPYRCTVQASQDGSIWSTLADYSVTPAIGSPVVINSRATARFLRLVFPASQEERATPAVFEWSVLR